MKRVLLTGATGFVGRQAVPALLRAGYEVHAVSSGVAPAEWPDVRWHRADLLSAGRIAGLVAEVRPTHLLHLAWYAVPGEYWASPENFRWVQASLDLFQSFASAGGERVVAAGTCAEYQWGVGGVCSEAVTPLKPATVYGKCKHAAQVMLDALAGLAGLSAAWGRVFFLYGPHERPERLVASVICSLLRGEVTRCSHGEQVRDFLHVEDAAEAFVALLETDVAGPVNLASGDPVRLKDVVGRIAERLGRTELLRFGAIPAPPDEPAALIADVARLKNEVGWSPSYDLCRGLENTVAWWEERLKNALPPAGSGSQRRVEGG